MRSAIIPVLRYEDAPQAILFLCDTFGFLPQTVQTDEEDQQLIHHAQLLLDGSMVMLSSAVEDESCGGDYGWVTPDEAGGITQSLYVVVADIDAHHARAVENGADILRPPHDNEGYPGRGYVARDPEGNVWCFASFDPYAPPADA